MLPSSHTPHQLPLIDNNKKLAFCIKTYKDRIKLVMRAIRVLSHRFFASTIGSESLSEGLNSSKSSVRLSKVLANSLPKLSRREAERSIKLGKVSLNGEIMRRNKPLDVTSLQKSIIKYNDRLVHVDTTKMMILQDGDKLHDKVNAIFKVWAVNKLPGELVTHHDPMGRPTLLERLRRGGGSLTKYKDELKPVGRLDMNTEGLILITTCGKFARDLELPSNRLHRSYRVRVHGMLTSSKLQGLRKGLEINGTKYKGMDVNIENPKSSSRKGTNTWLQVKCIEGKNRQIRKCMEYFGLKVTRLIRTSFGDYNLHSIPPGMAIEVPVKPIDSHQRRGMFEYIHKSSKEIKVKATDDLSSVHWISHLKTI